MKKKEILTVLLLLAACTPRQANDKAREDMELYRQQMSEIYVDTMVLHPSEFEKQIVCNGRLRAKALCELSFAGQGVVAEVCVKEGQHVAKGTLISSLDKRERQRELEKAEHELEKAKVELTDKLIGLGYEDLEAVPDNVRQRAEVMSGYYSAKYQLQSAQTALDECHLYAPFAGRVANLEAKRYQQCNVACTLIDDSRFEVEFKVLEAELAGIHSGQTVRVTPFVQDSVSYAGTIAEVNPMVDDKGLVKVKAQLSGREADMLDGMNVRVVIEQKMHNLFVVPKDAVVERDGYNVIFLLKEGRAVWTYVDVAHSNISSFAITGCQRKGTSIHEGDIVITSGNLNLADGTEVSAIRN